MPAAATFDSFLPQCILYKDAIPNMVHRLRCSMQATYEVAAQYSNMRYMNLPTHTAVGPAAIIVAAECANSSGHILA